MWVGALGIVCLILVDACVGHLIWEENKDISLAIILGVVGFHHVHPKAYNHIVTCLNLL